MNKIGLIIAVIVMGLAGSSVRAADFRAPGEEDGGNVVISAAEQPRNLYTAGGNVTVDGSVAGDLFVAGGNVVVSGAVEQDLNVAGGTVIINGSIGGDARIAGGNVNITAPINGDLLVAGGSVIVSDKSMIKGDLVATGGSITLNAPVEGTVRASADTVIINSRIAGRSTLRAAKQMVFGENAEMVGDVSYRGPRQAVVKEGAQISKLDYEQVNYDKGKKGFLGFLTFAFIVKLLAMILAGWLLVRLFRRPVQGAVSDMRQRPWRSLGVGFLFLVAVLIAAIILFVVLIGYYVALIALFTYALFLLIACLLGSVFVGALLIKWITRKPELRADWQAVVIGSLVMLLLGVIPVLGWLICFVLVLIALGAMATGSRRFISQQGKGDNMPDSRVELA